MTPHEPPRQARYIAALNTASAQLARSARVLAEAEELVRTSAMLQTATRQMLAETAHVRHRFSTLPDGD
jgi:hypothetical protein